MRSSAPIIPIRTTISPASSARAAAISPIRCGCSNCPILRGRCWRPGKSPPATPARCSPVADPDATARKIVAEGLTVRDVERLGRQGADEPPKILSAKEPAEIDADTRALEHSLSVALGTSVVIRHRGENGELRIKFKNLEQLDDFCRRLCQSDAAALRSRGASA